MSTTSSVISLAERQKMRRAPEEDRKARARARRAARVPMIVAFCGGLLLLAFGLLMLDREDMRSLRELPTTTRAALYERGMRDLKGFCLQPAPASSGSVRDYCASLAKLIERLPECAADCQSAVSAARPPARR